MPDYILTYTVTMPAGKGPAEKFRIKISAANEAEAKVKLHRFVQEKVQTNFLSCETDKPIDTDEAFKDMLEALGHLGKLEEFKKKYGFPKA
jgi:hypothetical protein